jgi:hypothetical protein
MESRVFAHRLFRPLSSARQRTSPRRSEIAPAMIRSIAFGSRDRSSALHRFDFMPPRGAVNSLPTHGWLRLETGPGHQQNCADCHKENARPVRSEPQESHAAPWRLQSVANRAGGFRATKRSPPNSTACHVQDSAENEQRAKSKQEHSRLPICRCRAQQNLDSSARWCDSFRHNGVYDG